MMDRLTERLPNGAIKRTGLTGDSIINRLAAYEDTGLMPDEIAAIQAELAAMRSDHQIKGVCADCLWCTESDATNRIYCVANGDGSEFETFPGEWCSGFTRRITDKDLERVWEESE